MEVNYRTSTIILIFMKMIFHSISSPKYFAWIICLELFNQLDLENLPTDIRKSNANYQELAVRGKHLPRKSPILAGCLSTVIPGTGKIYNERLADAVNAMITIGLSSWLAYDGFKKNGPNSVKGWTFGVVACSFYLGNIYGAVIASQTHNQQIESKFLEQLRWDIGQWYFLSCPY